MKLFGIGQLSGKLVLVGGKLQTGRRMADVHVFEDSQQWEKSIPAMPSPRSAAAVLSHNNSLVVLGGSNTGEPCATVFVYSGVTSQWSSPGSLPFACWKLSSAVVHNSCFLAGGYYGLIFNQQRRSVISAMLPSCSVVDSLPDMPHYDSSIATVGGSILAMVISRATSISMLETIQCSIAQFVLLCLRTQWPPYSSTKLRRSVISPIFPPCSLIENLPDMPHYDNSIAAIGGSILASGGASKVTYLIDALYGSDCIP